MKIARGKDKIWVHENGRTYALPLQTTQKRGGQGGGAEKKDLVAPFACRVMKIFLNAGDAVKSGAPALVVEAMKMEYSYSVPKDGVIAEVLVREGQTVQAGQPFVRWKDSP